MMMTTTMTTITMTTMTGREGERERIVDYGIELRIGSVRSLYRRHHLVVVVVVQLL
jgi:hypothetical protein